MAGTGERVGRWEQNDVVELSISETTARRISCRECGREYPLVTAFVNRDGDPFAIVFAACHVHNSEHVVWIDATLGSWAEDDASDHVTFSAKVTAAGAGAVSATVAAEGRAAFFGQKLDRAQALAHPWIARFWEVVDLMVTADPMVTAHLRN
jgi:hypothetical protein